MTTQRYVGSVGRDIVSLRVVVTPHQPNGSPMEFELSEEDAQILYERWDAVKWGAPLSFQGGVESITGEMVLSVQVPELVKVFGKTRADRLLKAAQAAAAR